MNNVRAEAEEAWEEAKFDDRVYLLGEVKVPKASRKEHAALAWDELPEGLRRELVNRTKREAAELKADAEEEFDTICEAFGSAPVGVENGLRELADKRGGELAQAVDELERILSVFQAEGPEAIREVARLAGFKAPSWAH